MFTLVILPVFDIMITSIIMIITLMTDIVNIVTWNLVITHPPNASDIDLIKTYWAS